MSRMPVATEIVGTTERGEKNANSVQNSMSTKNETTIIVRAKHVSN